MSVQMLIDTYRERGQRFRLTGRMGYVHWRYRSSPVLTALEGDQELSIDDLFEQCPDLTHDEVVEHVVSLIVAKVVEGVRR